jgi:aconitate hydratase
VGFSVVDKFVEIFGTGVQHVTFADRATIVNMSPEYGATCGLFAIDEQILKYLALTGRSQQQIDIIEAYFRAQVMWGNEAQENAQYHATLTLDLSKVVPAIAGPKRPQDRIDLEHASPYLRDLWASQENIQKIVTEVVDKTMFIDKYGSVYEGDEVWQNLETVDADIYNWPDSSYVKNLVFLSICGLILGLSKRLKTRVVY